MAVRDFKKPLIAGTSTTIVVFIPMMVLPGVTGKFLAYIPITVFSTLIAALFIALTINSALFYKLSKPKKRYLHSPTIEKFMTAEDKLLLANERADKEPKEEGTFSRREAILDSMNSAYENTLRKFISKSRNRRLSVLGPIVALFLSFIFLSPRIGFTLFPDGDNGRFDLLIEGKVGTPTEKTAEWLPFLEGIISDIPELKLYNLTVNDNQIQVAVELTESKVRKKKKQRDVFAVESDTLEKLAFLQQDGLKVESAVLAGGPPQSKPVAIKLLAESNEQFGQLIEVAKEFETYLRSLEGTKNVGISSQDTPGQFVFSFDKTKLSNLGLTPTDITRELASAINGFPAGSLKLDNEDVDIKLLYDALDENVSPAQIQNLIINTQAGPIRVGEILDYSVDNAVAEISREDTNITVRVESDLADGYRTK
ncbi:MAG: efflux RND transporter permease subunit [Candidatus Peribacteria bacterium]|nr:MAG: efflux RND transporter permease subunit [Candidatus Peribacteria bacterium]